MSLNASKKSMQELMDIMSDWDNEDTHSLCDNISDIEDMCHLGVFLL